MTTKGGIFKGFMLRPHLANGVICNQSLVGTSLEDRTSNDVTFTINPVSRNFGEYVSMMEHASPGCSLLISIHT